MIAVLRWRRHLRHAQPLRQCRNGILADHWIRARYRGSCINGAMPFGLLRARVHGISAGNVSRSPRQDLLDRTLIRIKEFRSHDLRHTWAMWLGIA